MAHVYNDASAATGEEALTLTTSFGGGSATNCYIGLTACNSTIVNNLLEYSAWTAASTLNRQIAILLATRTIDALPWWGRQYYEDDYDDGQGLKFPRTEDGVPSKLWDLDEDDFLSAQQTTLERATAFQAQYTLANSGNTIHQDNQAQGVSQYRYKLGSLEETFQYGGGGGGQRGTWQSLSPEARTELVGYVRGTKLERA